MNPLKTNENNEETKVDASASTSSGSEESEANKMLRLKESASSVVGMTYLWAKLTCAQVAKRKAKSYPFNPTVLDGSVEFQEYLYALKKISPPHRERFVITGRHWVAGDIQINSYGDVSVLFMDSVGIANIKEYDTYHYIQQFSNIFKDSVIYVPTLQRQTDYQSCVVFALDDVRHFYTIERYLEDAFKSSGLHGYLAESATRVTRKASDGLITRCEMPLAFIRTMQSNMSFFTYVIQGRSIEEKAVPVNKKGDILTVDYANAQFFNESKGEGLRIKQAFSKMAKFNVLFIEQCHDVKTLEEAMAPFALSGFKQRISPEKSAGSHLGVNQGVSGKSTSNSVAEEAVQEPALKRQKPI